MKPEDINLTTTSRQFTYETISRQLDGCNDIEELREICRAWVKLYMKQQETVSAIGLPPT
jgi:hypothetical protein|tara:strand:- start:310 stop:489 length:180 start_codon:yes stop_codon:yes gene_type:complete